MCKTYRDEVDVIKTVLLSIVIIVQIVFSKCNIFLKASLGTCFATNDNYLTVSSDCDKSCGYIFMLFRKNKWVSDTQHKA